MTSAKSAVSTKTMMMPIPRTAVFLRSSCRHASARKLLPTAAFWGTNVPCSTRIASFTIASPRSCIAVAIVDAWIDHGVEHIHRQIRQYEDEGSHQDERLHLRIIALDDGIDAKRPDPRHREHGLHDDSP